MSNKDADKKRWFSQLYNKKNAKKDAVVSEASKKEAVIEDNLKNILEQASVLKEPVIDDDLKKIFEQASAAREPVKKEEFIKKEENLKNVFEPASVISEPVKNEAVAKETLVKKNPVQQASAAKKEAVTPADGPLWLNQLFEGKPPVQNANPDKIQIIKNGVVIHELDLHTAKAETTVGRHPTADVQLDGARVSMFHLLITKKDGQYFLQDLNSDSGSFLNGKILSTNEPACLRDGYCIEIPDFCLKCVLPDTPALEGELEAIQNLDLPTAEAPKYCPVMSHLIEERDQVELWSKGTSILRVADIIEETFDTKTFRLTGGEKSILFSYQPGQFVTFLLNINGEEVQRSYSMSSSPSRPYTLDLTVKRVPNGLVSNWLCDNIKLGDQLKVKGPSGRFTCFHYPSHKIMFLAAGSGITPIMSMARWMADTAADIDAKFIASFKTPSEIIFRKELELLSARHANFRVALTVTSTWHSTESWTGFIGRINPQMIQIVAPDFQERHIFLCGSDEFMEEMKEILREMGFPMANLHSESFTAGRVAAGVETHPDNKGKYKVKFIKSGVTVKTDGTKSILELAEASGVEIDYSCRAGYCGDCKAKVKGKGKKCQVSVSERAEITDSEKAEGFVYTCCSYPESDIKVDA